MAWKRGMGGCCECETPPCEGRICVTVQATSCTFPITGVTVTITDDDSPPNVIDTPVTVGVIVSATILGGGSGYVNGTGYALGISGDGTGATGTFDVVGGHITNIVITDGGENYSTVTFSFDAAGPGSFPTNVTAVIEGKACTALPNAGLYHVTAHIPGATDVTTTVNAVCGVDNNVTLTYASGTIGRVCFSFSNCDCAGTHPIGGDFDISGAGIGSGSVDPVTGQKCVVLGVASSGSYSADVTYPSGYTETATFGVSNCGSTNVSILSTSGSAFAAVRCAPGCNVTFTLSGGITGTCSATPIGGLNIAACCITYGSPVNFASASGIVTVTTSGGVMSGGSSPFSGCYATGAEFFFDFENQC